MANESYFTRKLRLELEQGGLFRKIAAGMNPAGIPDLLGCVKGAFVAIEAKVWPNVPTPLQAAFLKETVAHGGCAYVATLRRPAKKWDVLDCSTGETHSQMTNNEAAQWILKQSSSSTSQTLSNT